MVLKAELKSVNSILTSAFVLQVWEGQDDIWHGIHSEAVVFVSKL